MLVLAVDIVLRVILHESGLLSGGGGGGVIVPTTAGIAITAATNGATRAIESNSSAVMASLTMGAVESGVGAVMATVAVKSGVVIA